MPSRSHVRTQTLSPQSAGQIYAFIELAAVLALGIAVGYAYVYGRLEYHDFMNVYIWPSILTVVILGYLNYRAELYSLERLSGFVTYSAATAANVFFAFSVVALIGVAAGVSGQFSRIWFGVWLTGSIVSVWTLRAIAARILTSNLLRGAMSRRAAIFGLAEPLDKAMHALAAHDSGVRVVGVFSPSRSPQPAEGTFDEGLARLVEFGQSHDLDTVIIALPPVHRQNLQKVLAELSVLPAEIKLLPDIETNAVPFHGVTSLARMQFIDLQHKPITGWGRMLKALEDYAIATIAIILLAPLLLVVALAIKLDSRGPILFKQQRHGLNNRVITVLKFRTMHVQPEGQRFQQATRSDRRVTRVGRILRRLSIDELPQLFNVLRGEMSIVGPRPHAIEMNAAYCKLLPLYNNRHRVKPGITGWAQINDYRGPTFTVEDMRKRLDCDLYYIENWSILFDLSIIAATPFIGLVHKNAV